MYFYSNIRINQKIKQIVELMLKDKRREIEKLQKTLFDTLKILKWCE